MRISPYLGLVALSSIVTAVALGCTSSASSDTASDSGAPSSVDAGAGADAAPSSGRPAGVATCYSSLADQHPAALAFWDAFPGEKRDARAKVITDLAAAVQANPSEEELALLLGLANLWRVGEPMPSEVNAQTDFVKAALAAQDNIEKASTLCPSDYRTAAWLGPLLVKSGQAMASQGTIDLGLKVLQQGIDHYPSFVLFSQLLVYADRPSSDPDFQKALQAVADSKDICDPATSSDPACLDTPHALHNIEGAAVYFGDAYAKAGKKDDAVRVYGGAKAGSGYATWPYKDLLDARIANIDARVAAASAGDAGASADAGASVENVWDSTMQCAVCHQR